MAQHMKLTMMILFANIILTIMFPSIIIEGDNDLFVQDSNTGEYDIDSDLRSSTESIVNDEGGLPIGLDGLTDIITLIWDFIQITFRILFASFVLLQYLPDAFRLLIGIPVTIAYIFAVVGWVSK